MSMLYIWIIISILALLIDVLTTNLFFAGFTIGGIIAMISWILNCSIMGQIIIFGVVSIIAIIAEFTWLRKGVKGSIPVSPRMENKILGMTITADEDIKDYGRLKVEGVYWSVKNAGDIIYKGEKAKVIGIEGNKLIIKK